MAPAGPRFGGDSHMGIEIERKFLVKGDTWQATVRRQVRFRQGYLANNERCSVRVRLAADRGFLNIKSFELGAKRQEFEYSIPADEAVELVERLCARPLIEKVRHYVEHGGHLWEIDLFEGDNAGLVMAEVELRSVDEPFEIPDWLGPEVTEDARYYNVNLIRHPYKEWR